MSKELAGGLEQVLAESLEPAHAPASLWYRVDAELTARRAPVRHSMMRLALSFGVLLVAVVSVGWYLDRPSPPDPSGNRPTVVSKGQHSCTMCHV